MRILITILLLISPTLVLAQNYEKIDDTRYIESKENDIRVLLSEIETLKRHRAGAEGELAMVQAIVDADTLAIIELEEKLLALKNIGLKEPVKEEEIIQ